MSQTSPIRGLTTGATQVERIWVCGGHRGKGMGDGNSWGWGTHGKLMRKFCNLVIIIIIVVTIVILVPYPKLPWPSGVHWRALRTVQTHL